MAALHVDPVAWVLCGAGAVGYVVGTRRLATRRAPWSGWRSAAWALGLATVVVATTSPLGSDAATDPTRQAISHSLLLLLAPLLLAWGAPQTLAVEAAHPLVARRVRAALGSRALRLLCSPTAAIGCLFASIGVVDLTSLHTLAGRHEALGEAVQVLLLAAGCVYMFPAFAPDPLPRRLRDAQAVAYLLALLPFFTLFGMAVESVGAADTLAKGGSVAAAAAFGQDLAGAGGVLWTVGGLGSIVLTIVVLVRWLHAEERATPGRHSGLDEGAHAQLVAWRAQREAAAADEAARRVTYAARRTGGRHATPVIDLAAIEEARDRVAPVLRPTPVDRSDSLSRLAGRPVLLKAEYLQRTGSFKIRGAYNRIAQLPPGIDVVAASAGNHAQGVALAATLTGRRSTIFMPVGAALPKIDATRGYGATVRLVGDDVDDCIACALEHAATTGAVWVPPFDDAAIIAGQATLGLELAAEAPDAEVVVVPAGGGGLLAGVATALHHVAPAVRVIGVEAAGAASMSAALLAGHPVTLGSMATIADGIAVRAVSALTLEHVQAYVEDVVTVDEEEISQAVLLLVERAKAVVEPSGATALAAVLAGKVPGTGPVVVVLSGGNVDPLLLTKLVDHGLTAAGRYLVLRIIVGDQPGALAALTAELAAMRLNVLDVEHHRSGRALAFTEVEVAVTVETRDREHHREILRALAEAGHPAEALT